MEALVHHLDVNRGLILTRSLLAGAAGLVPVPYVDDVLAATVRAGLIRRLAEIRNVDLDENAVHAIAAPRASRLLQAATMGSAALGGTRRLFRRLAASFLVVRRADEAMQTFQVGTLFDHYCARHHVGLGLDAQKAAELRMMMERAIRDTHGDALQRAFRSSLRVPALLFLALPRRLWSRTRARTGAPLEPEKLDDKLYHLESSSWVRRAVGSLTSVGKGYARALAGSFDDAWARAVLAKR